MRVKVRPMPPLPFQTLDLPHWHLPLQVQQVAPSLAPVSQPAGGISGGPSPNAGTQVPNEILAFLISAAIIFMLMIGRLQRRQRRRQEKTLTPGLKR